MILVTGATGYIGTHVANRLRRENLPVRALARAASPEEDVRLLRGMGCEVAFASLEGGEGIREALDGVDRIVHLVGSIVKPRGGTFRSMHTVATRNLIEACRGLPIRKIVFVSALGARPDAPSLYHRTKWEAEEEVRKSGIPWIVLEPSLVFGKTVGRRDSKMVLRLVNLIRKRKTVPLFGPGEQRLQPIHVENLAEIVRRALMDDSIRDRTFRLGGPEAVAVKELIDRIAAAMGLRRRRRHLPLKMAPLVAFVLERVQKTPLLSMDQVKLMREDNVCDTGGFLSVFPLRLTPLSEGLAYLAGAGV